MPTQCVADTAGKEISHGSYETKPSFEPPGHILEEGGLFNTVTVGGKRSDIRRRIQADMASWDVFIPTKMS